MSDNKNSNIVKTFMSEEAASTFSKIQRDKDKFTKAMDKWIEDSKKETKTPEKYDVLSNLIEPSADAVFYVLYSQECIPQIRIPVIDTMDLSLDERQQIQEYVEGMEQTNYSGDDPDVNHTTNYESFYFFHCLHKAYKTDSKRWNKIKYAFSYLLERELVNGEQEILISYDKICSDDDLSPLIAQIIKNDNMCLEAELQQKVIRSKQKVVDIYNQLYPGNDLQNAIRDGEDFPSDKLYKIMRQNCVNDDQDASDFLDLVFDQLRSADIDLVLKQNTILYLLLCQIIEAYEKAFTDYNNEEKTGGLYDRLLDTMLSEIVWYGLKDAMVYSSKETLTYKELIKECININLLKSNEKDLYLQYKDHILFQGNVLRKQVAEIYKDDKGKKYYQAHRGAKHQRNQNTVSYYEKDIYILIYLLHGRRRVKSDNEN